MTQSIRNKTLKDKAKGWFSRYIIPIIIGIIVISIVELERGVWKIASWKTSIEKDMNSMQKNINDIKSKLTEKVKDIQDSKNNRESLLGIEGMIGFINEELAQKRKSSYGVKYLLSYNICEFNEAFGNWDQIGGIPYLGCFFEVENKYNNLKTWCMVIGSFNDSEHPNRILLVSKKVSNSILFKQYKGILSVKIRLLNETEWKANKDCVRLYKSVYMLEKP